MTTATDEQLVMKVAEAAKLLRLDVRTVRDMFKRGELAGNQAGHAIRLLRSSVVDWASGRRALHARGTGK